MSNTSVTVLKLSTGEEIIAREEGLSDAFVIVSKARLLVVSQPNQHGQVSLQMFPWMMAAPDSTVSINRDLIVAQISERDLASEMVAGYISRTSPIQVAGSLIQGK